MTESNTAAPPPPEDDAYMQRQVLEQQGEAMSGLQAKEAGLDSSYSSEEEHRREDHHPSFGSSAAAHGYDHYRIKMDMGVGEEEVKEEQRQQQQGEERDHHHDHGVAAQEEDNDGVGHYGAEDEDEDDGIIHSQTCKVWLARQARSVGSASSGGSYISRDGHRGRVHSAGSKLSDGGMPHHSHHHNSPPREHAITLPHDEGGGGGGAAAAEEKKEGSLSQTDLMREKARAIVEGREADARNGYTTPPRVNSSNGMADALEAGSLLSSSAQHQRQQATSSSRPLSFPLTATSHQNNHHTSPPYQMVHHRIRQQAHHNEGSGGSSNSTGSTVSMRQRTTPSPERRRRRGGLGMRTDSDDVVTANDDDDHHHTEQHDYEEDLEGTPSKAGVQRSASSYSTPTNPATSSSSSSSASPSKAEDQSWGTIFKNVIVKPVQQITPQKVFFCNICLSNVNESERMIHRGENACTHAYCQDCIKGYMDASIAQRGVSIPCPMLGQNGCGYSYTVEDIQATVGVETLKKFEKFTLMAQSDRYRECPKPGCGKMIKGCACCPTMVCPDCKTRFCFFHSNAHPTKNCWQYALRLRKDSQQSRRAVLAISRPCPRCSAPTEKNGGCNHITCSNCLHQWCWLCGARYSDGHYEVYNIFGCPGGQFSRLGDVPFPAFILCLVVIPMRICCTFLLAPFLFLSALTLLVISLLWLPVGCLLLAINPCLSPRQQASIGLASDPGKPRWHFLFPVIRQLYLRRSRLASDMVLSALVTALVILLICLEAFWLPMGILVFVASILGSWSCRDALSALFLPVYMLNALMSGRA